jgi:hypothetical protein
MAKKKDEYKLVREFFSKRHNKMLRLMVDRADEEYIIGWDLTSQNAYNPPYGVRTFYDKMQALDEFETMCSF